MEVSEEMDAALQQLPDTATLPSPDPDSRHQSEGGIRQQEPESDASGQQEQELQASRRQEQESQTTRQEPDSQASRQQKPEPQTYRKEEPESPVTRQQEPKPQASRQLEPEPQASRQQRPEPHTSHEQERNPQTSRQQEKSEVDRQKGSSAEQIGEPSAEDATQPDNSEVIEHSIGDLVHRLKRLRQFSSNPLHKLAETIVNTLAEDELASKNGSQGNKPGTLSGSAGEESASKRSPSKWSKRKGERSNENVFNKTSEAAGGARPKQSQTNNGAKPVGNETKGGARQKQTKAGGGARPKEHSSSGDTTSGTSTKQNSKEDQHGSGSSTEKAEQVPRFQWRGHHSDLLERQQDGSLMHFVLPAPCLNSCTVHLGYLSRGIPTKRVQGNKFVEADDGIPIYRCQEESKCSSKCPVADNESFPVVAMTFDSFYKAYHVETDQCQQCDGDIGLARASTTGRARLIYEQMNGLHPQQTAFRIWEHERGAQVETGVDKPPPTNTLITVERVNTRDLRPQEYEHLFSVLVGLRGIQSLFTFIAGYWTRLPFHGKDNPEIRPELLSFALAVALTSLRGAGLLIEGDDHKLHGTVPPRCRPGMSLADVEAEAWFPRVDRNCVEMQWLQTHDKKRVRQEALLTAHVAGLSEFLWGTMISINDPMAEKYYLDMPFTHEEVPQEERLFTEERMPKPGTFRHTFLAELRAASGQERAARLGPHYSWNGVLYMWKLRMKPEHWVQSLQPSEHLRKPPIKQDQKPTTATGPHGKGDGESSQTAGGREQVVEGEAHDQDSLQKDVAEPSRLEEPREETLETEKEDTSSSDKLHCLSSTDYRDIQAADSNKDDSLDSLGEGNQPPKSFSSDIPDESTHESRPETLDASSSSPELSDLSSGQQMTPDVPIMKSAEQKPDTILARITRVESKDSGYLYSSGSGSGSGSGDGSGTHSRDDSTTRSGSMDGSSAPIGSGSSSSNSGQASPVYDELGVGSGRVSPADQKSSTDCETAEHHEQSSAGDRSLPSGSGPSVTSASKDVDDGHQEVVAAESEASAHTGTLHARPEIREESIPGLKRGDVTLATDDGNTSDASTIKGSASTVTKSSRRRSSGEISGGSDFDEIGAALAKSVSPSKSPGQNGERFAVQAIPEEGTGTDQEKETGDKSNSSQGNSAPSSSTASVESEAAYQTFSGFKIAKNERENQNRAPEQSRGSHVNDLTYQDTSRLSKCTKLFAHVKHPGVDITRDEVRTYMTDFERSCLKITGDSSHPAFMRIDDRQGVIDESLRGLSERDFKKQLFDAHTFRHLLNVSSRRNDLHGSEVQEDPDTKAGSDLPGTSGITSRADEAGSSTSVPEVPQDVESAGRILPKAVLSGRAYKRSPLRFLSSLDSEANHEDQCTGPPLPDINEHPFGLSSILQRQIVKRVSDAKNICKKILQRNNPLHCLCDAHVGDEHLEQLAVKLEIMLTKGHILQFLDGQKRLLDHVCKGSIMDYVGKAGSSEETNPKLLHDLMLILGLHHNPKASPYSYCQEAQDSWSSGKRATNTNGEYATMSKKDAAMYLTRHHLWCIRQIDFLDPSLDDPMTCMALHRHTIESPDKAGKLTPFQMFLERHLNPAVLKELCAKLNRHAKQRKSDRRFRDWTDTVPDELRVFILQMIYIASNHSRDERWDGPPREPSGKTRQDPSNSTKLIEDVESEFSLRREDEGDTKSSSDQKDEQTSAHCKESSHRPNSGRLFTSMDPCRFRQIAAAWHAFDLCEPPQRSERRRRVKNLQTVLDLLLNGPSLAVLPALLAIGSRTVRCHTSPAEGRPASSRRVDLTFVMDSRRYVYDVVISEPTRRRRRFRTTDPGVVNRIKQRLKPTTEKNMFVLMEEINNAVREIAKRKHPSFADGPSDKPKRVPVGPDHMHRYFFMDGLTVSEAERCAENDIFCMAPIPPDDPRRSQFVTLDDDMPKVSADNGRLICTPHGNRQKINFFHLRDADRPRHQLVCSAFHQLTAKDGRRAQQQVTKTQQQLREAVEQVTSRLSHGGTTSGLRHYHRLFLRAVSACIQNSILARGVARDDSSEDSGVSSAKKFSAFASTKALASYCDTEYETFLSDLLDWLEATPRVKPRPPKMTREEMHDQLTADLMDSATVDGAADMRCTMLIHGTNKMSRAMTRLEESRCVGEKKRQKYGNIVVSEVEDLDLF